MKRWLGLLLGLGIACCNLGAEDLPFGFIVTHQGHLNRLFEGLDSQHPQIGPMVEKWNAGQYRQAANALAAYFEEKAFPIDILEPADIPGDVRRHAEAARANSFHLLGKWESVPTVAEGGLDWQARGSAGDKERAWMLNRHRVFTYLSHAYRQTGEAAYKDTLNSLWQDWILNSPYPDRLNFSPQWRALEAARRMLNSWIHVFYGKSPLAPGTRLLVLSSIIDHGDALRHHASIWGGNHLITERLALLALATAWPEFKDAAEWKAFAVEALSSEILEQTYPDGSYKELSNHYHHVVLKSTQYLLHILKLEDPEYRQLPAARRISKMWEFYAGVMRPDGTGPLNNASDLEHNATLLEAVSAFHERPDWLAMATNGAMGILPAESPSRFFPWAGQAILRNHWGAGGDWIYFDAGPYGTAHQHVDRLHLSASIDGRPVLVDSGRYTYQPGPWRDFFKGPESHSVILLDGEATKQGPLEVAQPMPVLFEDRDAVVFTAATARFHSSGNSFSLPGMTPAIPWTRAVLYDKRGFAIALDHLVTFSPHELTAIWNFHPDLSKEEVSGYMRLASPKNAFSQSVEIGTDAPGSGGFYSPEYGEKYPSPQMRLSGRVNKPTTLIWLLQGPDSPPFEIEVLSPEGSPTLQIRVKNAAGPVAEARVQLHPVVRLSDYATY